MRSRSLALALAALFAAAPANASGPSADPAAPEGTVVDREGRPLADVAVFLAPMARERDGTVRSLARTTTDGEGRFRMATPPAAALGKSSVGMIWAYRPGLALGSVRYVRLPHQEPARIRLDRPGRRVVTLRRREGSPARGVKVAPLGAMPDELTELMALVSDERGEVVITSFPQRELPTYLRVWSSAGGVQVVRPAEEVGRDAERIDLVVEPAGALAGVVKRTDGKSPAGLIAWLEAEPGQPVRVEPGPVRVGPDGAFRTPPILLAGFRYRVIIEGDDQTRLVSPWIDPAGDGKTASLGDLVVEALQVVSGRVVDRQDRPIAGAEVIQAGDGPERTTTRTDAQGRFRLGGYQDGRGLVFARAEGFRFGGRLVVPGENAIVLTRVTEAPDRALSMLAPPLPAAELRSLARRVLDPYLEGILKTMAVGGKHRALEVLAILEPAEALEKLAEARLRVSTDALLRGTIASELARTDPDEGTAVAESIAGPADRAAALIKIVDVLPASARTRRLDLLGKAVVHARTSTDPDRKLWYLGDVGERLVDEGELEKARPLLAEGLALARTVRNTRPWHFFAARLARVNLPAALGLIDELPTPERRSRVLANTAIHIAASQPAECERLMERLTEMDRVSVRRRACDGIARTDPARARRLIRGVTVPYQRADLSLILARRLAPTSKAEAESEFRAALAAFQLSPQGTDRGYLPMVEATDPALVPEYLWECLAQRKPDTGLGNAGLNIRVAARDVLIVAHYDRALAAALWSRFSERIRALDPHDTAWRDDVVILTQAHLDPRAAVEWVESLPAADKLNENGQYEPRIVLSRQLALWSVGRHDALLAHHNSLADQLGERDLRD